MKFVVDKVCKNVTKKLDSSQPATAPAVQPDWDIITQSIVNGSRTMEALVMHQVMSSGPSPMKNRYFEDVMATNALEAATKRQKAKLEQQQVLIAKERADIELMELQNRSKPVFQKKKQIQSKQNLRNREQL